MLAVSSCSESGSAPGAGLCQSAATSITAIQGDGFHSPLEGKQTVTRGIVTFVRAGDGFYLESAAPRPTPGTSRALFVADAPLSGTAAPGQLWTIAGRVTEMGSSQDKLTAVTGLSAWELCESGIDLPTTPASLPLGPGEREALESMRLTFSQPLTVSDVYNLHRSELTVSANGVPTVPTEVLPPGEEARRAAEHNRVHSLVGIVPDAPAPVLPVGTELNGASGLMGHDGRNQRFYLDPVRVATGSGSAAVRPRADGQLRIVSSNLLNFFNGDGRGGGFPTERGAETLAAFEAQSERILAAVEVMQPDLLAVQELENDGFGADSAAASLLKLLNGAGPDEWAAVDPGTGRIGGDVITVGLFYRTKALATVGPARLLDGPLFEGLSRRPLAQVFRDHRSGQSLLVAVNHLKSKGRCPESGEDADRHDGQSCWNSARAAAVNALVPWLQGLAEAAGTANILVTGDMNAWRLEDPIRRFRHYGFDDLVEQRSGLPQQSFLYWGQVGTLDYAFASPALTQFAVHAENWNVNSPWPQRMKLPEPWLRFSDHDPVVVDFDFSQADTSH